MGNKKEYNILILGETRVGKSTFINAFVNYINFSTLDDALAAEKIHALIPSRFMIVDADFELKEIIFGDDKNESFLIGESSTQECRSYTFQFENVIIRLIDTPGVGNTRGIETDQANFENLLAYLAKLELKEISAMVIMLKPNESRVTVLFEYCIKQLLCSLERSAVDNIIFLFTNSRATFYMPGDTHAALEIILKKIASTAPHVSVPYGRTNTFCMDNEAFRFLLAKRQGCVFPEHAQKSYKESWNVSVSVCKRLIEYVTRLPPHRVQDTVTAMDARRTIVKSSEPLGVITELIENIIRRVDRLKEDLADMTNKIEDLVKYLYVTRINLKVEHLKYPQTVCISPQCTESYEIGDATMIRYKQICHPCCYLDDHHLQRCEVMEIKNGVATCRICGHTYHQHQRIYYDTTPVEEQVKDKDVDYRINKTKIDKVIIENELKKLRVELKEYENKRKIILNAIAKLAYFLINVCILPFNDVDKEYMNMLIKREKQLGLHAKQDVINNFEKIIEKYEEENSTLTQTLAEVKKQNSNVKTVVSASEVMNIMKELHNLKLTGKTAKALYDVQQPYRAVEIVINATKNLLAWSGEKIPTKSKRKTSLTGTTALETIETESSTP